jgi:ribosomal protein L11 methyltransferase
LMFVWRKRAGAGWLAANEGALREIAGRRLAIVSKPAHRNAIAEIASPTCSELEKIRTRFGGVIEKLPRNWLRKFLRGQKPRPLKIGKRLVIVSSGRSTSRSLVIPAGAAFGTGAHVTTAMSLRMLERTTSTLGRAGSLPATFSRKRDFSWENRFRHGGRKSEPDWHMQAGSLRSPDKEFSLLDLGTGSGILALAAARFGAKRIIAIDHDPIAIATAKKNARRNKIEQADFRVADVRRWKFPARIDIITANLFSELLIKILPKLKRAERLILSGVLREQEADLRRALKRNGIAIVETRRRGKWIAILGRGAADLSSRAKAEGSR